MTDKITYLGNIKFEPENRTKKHNSQSSWKKIAMIHFDGEITDYYAWFIKKRYNLSLNKPIRGAHISFINDSIKDLSINDTRTMEEIDFIWNNVKLKWDGKSIPVVLDLVPRSDSIHWWLNAPHDENKVIIDIRKELGLGKPYYNLHMSIGYANSKNEEHSKYIVEGLINGFII